MAENSRVAWRSKRSGRTGGSVKERNTKLSMIAAVAMASLAGAAAVTAQQVVVEATVTVGSTEPTPESPALARKEGSAALAPAKHDCLQGTGQGCTAELHDADARRLQPDDVERPHALNGSP